MGEAPNGERPGWWEDNESIRSALGLPEYEPPRFEDGTYTHEVVPELEERFGVEIRFVGVNTDYGDDWAVRIDGEPAMSVGRHRDENGNTVFEITAGAFRERLSSILSAQ